MLKKSEETRAQSEKTADNPLSVAAMNSLMSMEVKLQTNLTDQNSKFIKVCLSFQHRPTPTEGVDLYLIWVENNILVQALLNLLFYSLVLWAS